MVPPEHLSHQAIELPAPGSLPPLRSRRITPLDLLTIRDIVGLSLSPDNRCVAFLLVQADLATDSHLTALWVTEVALGAVPRNLGSVGPALFNQTGELVFIPLRWTKDNQSIVMLAKMSGAHRQLWRIDAQTGNAGQLTFEECDIESFELTERDCIKYTVRRPSLSEVERKQRWPEIHARGVRMEFMHRAPFTGSGIVDRYLKEKFPARPATRCCSLEGSEVGEDVAEPGRTPAPTPGKGAATSMVIQAVPHPFGQATAFVRLDLTRETQLQAALFIQAGEGAEPIAITEGSLTSIPLITGWSADGSRLFYVNQSSLSALCSLSWPAEKPAPRIDFESRTPMLHVTRSRDGLQAVYVRQDAVTPGCIMWLDLATGVPRPLFDPNPEFAAIQFTDSERMEWQNRYGDTSCAYLIKPAGYEPGKKYPLIVSPYRAGSGFLRGGVGDEFPFHAFAAQGFAVLVFDVGAAHCRQRQTELTRTLRWLAPVDGIRDLLEKLDKLGMVDASRRGICGFCFGGGTTTYTLSHHDWFQAAAIGGGDWSPVTPYFMAVSSKVHASFHAPLDRGIPGDPLLDSLEEWKAIAPALNVDKIKAPLLINATDTEVFESVHLFAALKEREKPVELWVYPDELHIKFRPRHRHSIYQRNVDWFRFWLQDYEDPAPEKQEQYLAWKKLRLEDRAARLGVAQP